MDLHQILSFPLTIFKTSVQKCASKYIPEAQLLIQGLPTADLRRVGMKNKGFITSLPSIFMSNKGTDE